jgi:trans-2,3-dihydro-3-hydroxyanthranilate isomerase
MARLHYHKVDVFTDRAFGGNPLSVFTDGQGISAEMMQILAKELNLSEATFVLPAKNPNNNYHVRIFTPARELPIAGHPTVGTAFILAREGMIERKGDPTTVVFEEGVGDIPVALQFEGDRPGMIWMTQPQPRFGREANAEERTGIAAMLSLPAEAIDNRYPVQTVTSGVSFLYVPVTNLAAIKGIRVNLDLHERVMSAFDTTGVFVFTTEVETAGSTVHSRMFAPAAGVLEDPATGAASGPLGAYLVRYGLATDPHHIVSEQGLEMGRPSYVQIQVDKQGDRIGTVRVGGTCHYMGEGFSTSRSCMKKSNGPTCGRPVALFHSLTLQAGEPACILASSASSASMTSFIT